MRSRINILSAPLILLPLLSINGFTAPSRRTSAVARVSSGQKRTAVATSMALLVANGIITDNYNNHLLLAEADAAPRDAQIYLPEQFGSSSTSSLSSQAATTSSSTTVDATTAAAPLDAAAPSTSDIAEALSSTAPPETVDNVAAATTTTTAIIENSNKAAAAVSSGGSSGFDTLAAGGDLPLPTAPTIGFDTIALVCGQENYGLAIVLLGEALWSFGKSPSIDHGLKTLVPATVSAAVLCLVSGPMITSGDAESIRTGLLVSTAVSVFMGGAYGLRLSAPFSPSPKEITAGGLLFAVAGFFSFGQNLIVDGFVKLPSLPPALLKVLV